MTKESLEGYRSKKAEIAELHNALLELGDGKSMIDNDTILDCRSGYPVPQPVVGVDWGKVFRTENRYKKRISVLEEECQKVEEFVESIPDSLTRRIFRKSFIEGKTQEQVSKDVYLSQSSISKKINELLKME